MGCYRKGFMSCFLSLMSLVLQKKQQFHDILCFLYVCGVLKVTQCGQRVLFYFRVKLVFSNVTNYYMVIFKPDRYLFYYYYMALLNT